MIEGTPINVIVDTATREGAPVDIVTRDAVYTPVDKILPITTSDFGETMKLRNLDCIYAVLIPFDLKFFVNQRLQIRVTTHAQAAEQKKQFDASLFLAL